MNLKQLFCRHEWHKVGGANRVGPGKFKQNFRCAKCNKFETHID